MGTAGIQGIPSDTEICETPTPEERPYSSSRTMFTGSSFRGLGLITKFPVLGLGGLGWANLLYSYCPQRGLNAV